MRILFFVLGCCFSAQLMAQQVYEINAAVKAPAVYSGHLKLGGSNGKGDKISVNNYFMSMNDKPFIPVTGEFHFSRYPKQYWDESIKKMKAGGITVIPTYIFWNLHEEEESEFVWTGDKDVRAFVELCRTNDMQVIVRIGPFCHGEIRNGGLPDWLLAKPLNIRMNDPMYLSYVERLYREIGNQLKGLYFKDNGPIIGVQLENEYQHSAAPWGITYPGQAHDFTASERDRDVTHEGVAVSTEENPYTALGNDHMKVLKSLAEKAGIIAPLYTATGWGNAAIIPNESLPVTAAYAYPFWTPKRDHSPFFLYKDMHKNPDYAPVRYKPEDYPALPAELGSGISLVYQRRPLVVHQSFDAMVNRCLGSGANGVGYYMFHGGSTPRGKHNFMNDEAYGLNKISYEYQGPIGEYGQVREGFHRLKLLHFFLKDFGERLAPMTVVLPQNAATLKPEDTKQLRYAVRISGNSGFLFLNNFQDDTAMLDQQQIQVRIKTADGSLTLPEKGGFDLHSGENLILPFNFSLNGAHLNYATAQLLMKSDNDRPYYVFFAPPGITPEFSFAPGTRISGGKGVSTEKNAKRVMVRCSQPETEFSVTAGGKTTKVLVIDKSRALNAYIVAINGKKSLVFSDALVLQDGDALKLLRDSMPATDLDIYPNSGYIKTTAHGTLTSVNRHSLFKSYRITMPDFTMEAKANGVSSRKFSVALPDQLPDGVNDVLLNVDYTGDTGMAFADGTLVADHFYNGPSWQIGLRKFLTGRTAPKEMVFYFRPMEKDASYLLDLQAFPQYIPDFGTAKSFLKIRGFSFIPQYTNTVRF